MKTLSIAQLITFLVLFNLTSFSQPNQKIQVASIGFYNVENLFDTINQPRVRDGEYTPEGRNNWDTKKYNAKLFNLAKVISGVATEVSPDGCAILGVSEVENKSVLEDLVKEKAIAKREYKIIHHDSPDERGIDVAILYQEKYFKFKSKQTYKVVFANDSSNKTRDQLVVTGDFLNEEIHIIVGHWPSRGGGQVASEPRRIEAAIVGRKIIDSLFNANANAKIILMGDLNDDPVNKSLREYIKSEGKLHKMKSLSMYNPMFNLYKKGIGTLAWGDAWNLFDQILVSNAFLNSTYETLSYLKVGVYNKPFMLQKTGRYKGYPFRTRAGGTYLGGYSDHFPVYLVFVKALKD